ncbi:MAG: peptidyl-prolyl cis-trans isomerase, partial [Epsilonproteobacteria bacterium]|nr:peptidyl-prolyl cis-trans isomerase [Campylobacterota bacterium]
DTNKLTTVHNVSYPEIQQQYGRYFAQQLFLLKKGKWSQPIQTQDGFMLIKVISYDKLGEKQRFDDVEYQVYNDYKNDFIKENKEKKLQKILKRYQLDIQKND